VLFGDGLNSSVNPNYNVNAGVIEGKSANGRIVFTLTQTAGSNTADPTDDEFTYELKDQLDHPVPGSTDDDQTMVLNLSPAIVATDKDADPISLDNKLQISVEDDVPGLVDDSSSLTENEATVIGNVLTNDTIGADEHSGGDMVVSKVVFNGSESTPTSTGISITGVYGVLTISSDGAWRYTSNDSVDHTDTPSKVDTFTYSVIDADGDEVTADLKLTVTDLGPSIVPDHWAVKESDFGTSIQTSTVALNVSTPADSIDDVRFEDPTLTTGQTALKTLGLKTSDDDSSLSYSLSSDGLTLTAKDGWGTTVFDVVISESSGSYYYTYTQYEALEHRNGTTLLERLELPFVFEAEDIDGSISRGTGTVTVVDDEPGAVDDYDASTTLENQAWYSVAEGGFTLAADDSVGSDPDKSNNTLLLNDDAGADGGLKIVGFSFTDESGAVQTNGVPGSEADTLYGKITIAEDGSFEYTSDPYADHTTHEFLLDTITYTVEDADGDQSTATFKVKVTDLASSITAPAGLTFDERYLPTGSDPKPSETSDSQSIDFTWPSDPVNVVFAYNDGEEIADAHMYRTTFGQQSAPEFGDLTSGGEDVKYTISSDYRTITAYIDDNGTTGYQLDDTTVFTVELTGYTNSTDFDNLSDLGYTFTLFEPLDHTDDVEVSANNIKMQFTVGIYDANEIDSGINDWEDIPVTINILDDEPVMSKSMTVLEDSSDPDADPSHANTITTSADADSSDISIPAGSGPSHGTATVNANGTISYTPDPDYSGTDTFTYEYTDENTSAPISVPVTVTVTPYVDGYDFEVQDSAGDEFNGGTATSSDRIKLDVVDNGLLDDDGSETAVSAIITGVPNGFLVYAGADAESATMVLNGGDDGSGSDTNQWILTLDDYGTLPRYVGVQPPEDVSGSFDLSLDIVVQESDGSQKAQSDTFTLTVDPVAYAIESSYFNPTDTFGDEGDMVPINLNVSLEDTVDYYPLHPGVDDLETVTLTFSGIGPYASFYDAQGDYIDSVAYDDGTDTYTVSGIPADEINDVSFVQAAFDSEVEVTAYTVDGTSTSVLNAVSDAFHATVYEVLPTTGDDVLLYDGVADAVGSRSYNGLAGDDVLQMRNNEDLDFDDLPDISNIEVLDMSNDTANVISNLSPEDVLDITDGANKLFIDADGKDSVLGDPGSTWTQEADQSIGGTTYEVYSATVSTAGGPEAVTLYVDNEASISL